MATKSIFFTGATGYIGGAFLNRLLSHPERSSFSISILVRDVEKAEKFKEQFGLNPIVGSLDNFDLLEEAASKADIVVHTVSHPRRHLLQRQCPDNDIGACRPLGSNQGYTCRNKAQIYRDRSTSHSDSYCKLASKNSKLILISIIAVRHR
jgi:hypothetical protein